jgi:Ca2+-binding RTX toxin-like protein
MATYTRGSSGADFIDLHAETTSQYIHGGSGDGADRLIGGSADDALNGGAGNDRLEGGEGNDLLTGGEGADRLYGGEGDDTFVFNKGDFANDGGLLDHIIDFEGAGKTGGDMIRFTGFSDQATFEFSHMATAEPHLAVYTVTDGDYTADFMIQFAENSDGSYFDPTADSFVTGDYAFYA